MDCGPRLADTRLYEAALASTGAARCPPAAGDCVAPRTAAEAVLEGRRRALEIGAADPGALEREQPPPPCRRRRDSPPRVSRRLPAGRGRAS